MNKSIGALLLLALSACSSGGGSAPAARPPASNGPAPSQFARPAKAESVAERDARVKRGSEHAAKLIRESVPLVEEVRGADPASIDPARRDELRAKAGDAESKLLDAAATYRAIELDSPEQSEIANRLKSIRDIIAALRGDVRKL